MNKIKNCPECPCEIKEKFFLNNLGIQKMFSNFAPQNFEGEKIVIELPQSRFMLLGCFSGNGRSAREIPLTIPICTDSKSANLLAVCFLKTQTYLMA